MTIKLPFSTLEWQLQENDIKQLPKEPSQDSIKYSDLSLGRALPKSYLFFSLSDKDSTVISIFSLSSLSLELWAEKYWLWMLICDRRRLMGLGHVSMRDVDHGPLGSSGRCPGEGHSNPLQYSCLGNPQGQRSLEGYNPWGHRVGPNWGHLGCTHAQAPPSAG